jgi:predicted outer membrane repeat protein
VGGLAGEGLAIPTIEGGPATNGADGWVFSTGGIAGGAAYYRNPSANAHFTNCTFTGNKAYAAYYEYQSYYGEDIWYYTVGGALYSDMSNIVDLNTCDFTDNLGGAVYCDSGCNLNFDDCSFTNNSETANGGAVYIDQSCSVDIQGCTFGGNSAYDDGGALKCRSNATITNCSFGGNRADSDNDGHGYGGGMDDYDSGTTLTVDFNACTFAGNQAIYGGGFSSKDSSVNLTDCYFIDNTAREGGGLDLANVDLFVTGGVVNGNNATNGYGGGLMCSVTEADVCNCVISDNSASGNGGAIDFYGGFVTHLVKNCLITGNSAADSGGGISCELFALPEIQNCTFSDNLAGGHGGAIFTDWSSSPQITNCIFEGCNNHAIHEEDYGGDALARYNLFYNNPNGDYYDSGTHSVYTGPGQVGSIPGGSNNLYGDPLFVSGDLGGYYLSQIPCQGSNSPAINNGSDTAANLGLNTFTTRTDNVGDADQVDRGYHYPDSTGLGIFQLTASVIGGNGTIAPTSGTYYAGTVVTLTATPSPGWRVKGWSGTYNNSSTSTTNTVVMNSNKTVGVEFDQPKTLIVAAGGGGGGYYSTIQDAVSASKDGDTIVVYPGTYYGGYSGTSIYIDKSITVRSLNPDDPCCVAATIIDGYMQSPFQEGYTNTGVEFGPNTDANTIFNGFTIQNCGGLLPSGLPGQRTPINHPNGYDGMWGVGSAIWVYHDGGPIIKNCVIRDNSVIAGNGDNGVAATGPPENLNAGRGGWGGFAWGGAVYCGVNSSPTFINCRIIDNEARGGNGGNGGNDVYPGGEENYGGSWSIRGSMEYPVYDIDPYTSNITPVVDSNLWERWDWDRVVEYYFYLYGYYSPPSTIYIGDYRWYSGLGGGVFIDKDCTVTFTDCEISRNAAKGGMSGQGGLDFFSQRPEEPLIPFEIPSFGGGVYCAADSAVTFTGCTITDNISSEPDDPPNNRIDPYLGHGGGVCAEDTATLKFTDCTFNGNDADAGGGLHFANANAVISDCNFTFNSASQGGGLFMQHGLATILRSDFIDNMAFSDVSEPNAGSGGGLHLLATEANIIDCNISGNQADASGGGLFFNGENDSLFKNCLLTNNSAGRDGGGISSNNFSSILISNCTIADNITTGIGGYGGGLYCSYDSYTNIINSIIWDNSGQYGPQLAIIGVGGHPSGIDISYSDVQGGQSYVFIGSGCTLNWGAGNIHADPCFATGPLGNYYLSQIAAGQPLDSNCVDTGSSSSENLGMNRYTTRTDEQPDRKTVDMGYHYPFTPQAQPCRFCELVRDGIINFEDFAVFALNWLNEGCSQANEHCQHADVTLDAYVNFEDAQLFAECWLVEDTYPPVPNPSEWKTEPYPSWSPAHPNSISMAARTATDAWDFWVGNVQYYFDCVSGGCHDSGWQDEPNYIDSNLVLGVEYGYRVRARDASEQILDDGTGEPGNKTGWSPIRYAIAGEEPPLLEDHNPPTPNPMTWATVPYATSPTSVRMVATTATDDTAGVEYYFEDFDFPAVNSGWQSSPTWVDTTCEPQTTYTYRVRARDTSAWHNETGWSALGSATTPEEEEPPPPPDTNPPAPVAWEVAPYETGGGLYAYANMTAAEAIDPEGNGPVQYYFECVSITSINSGWTTEQVWNDVYIGRENQFLYFHFRVRDNLGNTSSWSTSLPCY